MNYSRLFSLLFLLPTAFADDAAMRQSLAAWEQEMTEYRAAQEFAKTPEQKATLKVPDGIDIAASLWQAISAKTGEREIVVQPTYAQRRQGAKPTTRKVPTYEFEQEWAVPAVAWFINHPDAYARMMENKPRQQAYFAEALVDSINRIHFRNPAIAPACAKLAESASSKVYDILEKIYTNNPNATARGNAALGMSLMLGNPLLSGTLGSANTRAKRVYYLRQALTLAPADAMFGDVPFQEVAEELTYALRYLSEGSVPPQIKVQGLDNTPAMLPQPGKAHLLYFWAPQSGDDITAVRHMLEAQERYPQLAICPIVAHQDPATWHSQMQQENITTCYMDDEQGSAGTAYRLAQLPTAVLLNERCRILYIGAPGLQLQTAIDSLFTDKGKEKPSGGRIIIGGQEEKPAIQPPAPTPKAPTESEAPALREMPEF